MIKAFAFVFFLGFHATAGASSTFEETIQRSQELVKILIQGVDECFNPDRRDTNEQVKKAFRGYEEKLRKYSNDWANGTETDIRRDAAELKNELTSFGAHESIFCGTRRQCLEEGFKAIANPRYPRCQPVNGNVHGNKQFRALVEFIDVNLPTLFRLMTR